MGDSKTPPRSRAPSGDPSRLMARIDRALAEWPSAREGATDDDRAAVVTARATGGGDADADAGDDDVLAPPLPPLPGEASSGVRPRRRPAAWIVAGGLAAAAMAATFVAIDLRRQGDPGPVALTAAPQGGASVAAAAPMPRTTGSPPPVDVPGIAPSLLPVAPSAAPSGPVPPALLAAARRAPGARAGGAAAGPSPADPAAGATPAASPDDSLQPAAAVAPGSSLGPGPWSVPRRPSVGAIQGALGSAIPGARACLDASDPPYRAVVTFQSDGTVRDVALPETGEPSGAKEACVKAALRKAAVPPFAEESYAAPATVRSLGR